MATRLTQQLALICTACVLIGGCEVLERPEEHYATMDAAKREGKLSSWLPAGIPESCTDVYIKTDIDINRVWARFQCPIADIERFVVSMRRLSTDEVAKLNPRARGISWWDSALREGDLAKSRERSRFEVFTSTYELPWNDGKRLRTPEYVAVDRDREIFYYWHESL